jgi:hypothetical protein
MVLRRERGLTLALGTMRKCASVLLISFALGASAAEPFVFDRQLALELAKAYLHSNSKAASKVEVRTQEPSISSAIAAHNRHLVFVTYADVVGPSGSYVVLELCSETSLLTVVDVARADPIANYRLAVAGIEPTTYFAGPEVCPAEVP